MVINTQAENKVIEKPLHIKLELNPDKPRDLELIKKIRAVSDEQTEGKAATAVKYMIRKFGESK